MQHCEKCEALIDELAKINGLLDRLHGFAYDFHNIGAVGAVQILVEEYENRNRDKPSFAEVCDAVQELADRMNEMAQGMIEQNTALGEIKRRLWAIELTATYTPPPYEKPVCRCAEKGESTATIHCPVHDEPYAWGED